MGAVVSVRLPDGYRFAPELSNGIPASEMLCCGGSPEVDCEAVPICVVLAEDGCFTGVAICANEQHAVEALTYCDFASEEVRIHMHDCPRAEQ